MFHKTTRGLTVAIIMAASATQFSASSMDCLKCCFGCGDSDREEHKSLTQSHGEYQHYQEPPSFDPSASAEVYTDHDDTYIEIEWNPSTAEAKTTYQTDLLTKCHAGKISQSVWILLEDSTKAEKISDAIKAETDPDAEFNILIHNDRLCKMEIAIKDQKRIVTIRFTK